MLWSGPLVFSASSSPLSLPGLLLRLCSFGFRLARPRFPRLRFLATAFSALFLCFASSSFFSVFLSPLGPSLPCVFGPAVSHSGFFGCLPVRLSGPAFLPPARRLCVVSFLCWRWRRLTSLRSSCLGCTSLRLDLSFRPVFSAFLAVVFFVPGLGLGFSRLPFLRILRLFASFSFGFAPSGFAFRPSAVFRWFLVPFRQLSSGVLRGVQPDWLRIGRCGGWGVGLAYQQGERKEELWDWAINGKIPVLVLQVQFSLFASVGMFGLSGLVGSIG